MTNLSLDLRSRLDKTATISSLKLVEKTTSSVSKTQKFLWELEDGLRIESVYIPEDARRTVCISSQVGCKLGCVFCATGRMGWIRNLKPHEIVDQVVSIHRLVEKKPTNIVMMGMGEPFFNYENVIKALTILNDMDGLAIGHRKITISTAGVIPRIIQYGEENHPFKLAISLNATTDMLRSSIMPLNRKYSLEKLLQAARKYSYKTKKRLTFEYVLLKDINDSPDDAARLLKLLQGFPCKVNLIAYNPTEGQYIRPDEERIRTFAEIIHSLCAPVTLRLSKGEDIDAACGQLAVKNPTDVLVQ